MSNPTNRVSGAANQTELNAHTEQALIELIYVRTGNDLIGSAMANLDQALQTTQSVLNILQALQDLHNQIDVRSKSAFPFLFSTGGATPITGNPTQGTFSLIGPSGVASDSYDASNYQKLYESAASAYFGQAIEPFFAFTSPNSPGFNQFVQTLTALKTKLRLEISALSKITPSSAQSDPTSLLSKIRNVYNELPADMSFNSVETWAIDNYRSNASTGSNLAGALQNDLTFAITAAEALNDTQKERVRRFLFIFQQYYQSAAAIISKINQITEQMAQKISQ